MIGLANAAVRRPRMALAIAAIVSIALGLIGLGVDHSLSPSITTVPGTQSATAEQLATARFGPTQLVPILLEGPKAQLNVAGTPARARPRPAPAHPRPVRMGRRGRLERTAAERHRGDDRRLGRPLRAGRGHLRPAADRRARAPATPPATVRAYITGQPSIDRAIKDQSISDHPPGRADRARDPLPAAARRPARAARRGARHGRRRRHRVRGHRRDGARRQGERHRPALARHRDDDRAVARRGLLADDPRPLPSGGGTSTRARPRSPPPQAVLSSGRTILLAGTGAVLALVLADVLRPDQGARRRSGRARCCARCSRPAPRPSSFRPRLALWGDQMNRWRLPTPGVRAPRLGAPGRRRRLAG